jgi:hypothetical protein
MVLTLGIFGAMGMGCGPAKGGPDETDTGTGTIDDPKPTETPDTVTADPNETDPVETDPLEACEACPDNSGYPCPCLGSSCDDGSICAPLGPSAIKGVCFKQCAVDDDCVVPMDCFAEGKCTLETKDKKKFCGYVCSENADCPTDMVCDKSLDIGICAPRGGCEVDPAKEPCETECPLNSGYPCGCDSESCADGSPCAPLPNGSLYGLCLKDCTGTGKCDIEGYGCDAVPTCALQVDATPEDTADDEFFQFCALLCCQDEDCPAGMRCDDSLDLGICAVVEASVDSETTNQSPDFLLANPPAFGVSSGKTDRSYYQRR